MPLDVLQVLSERCCVGLNVARMTVLPATQSLFQQAIEQALQGSGDGCGYQWYVYSYQAGYLLRRAAFILERLSECSTPPWPPA